MSQKKWRFIQFEINLSVRSYSFQFERKQRSVLRVRLLGLGLNISRLFNWVIVPIFLSKNLFVLCIQRVPLLFINWPFLCLLVQMKLYLIKNRKENCQHGHNRFKLKGIGNIFFWMQFLSEHNYIMNQTENCHYDHVPFNLKGITDRCFWVYRDFGIGCLSTINLFAFVHISA